MVGHCKTKKLEEINENKDGQVERDTHSDGVPEQLQESQGQPLDRQTDS